MTDFMWQDPPAPDDRRLRWGDTAARLVEQPGRWALITSFEDTDTSRAAQRAGSFISNRKRGGLGGVSGADFEFSRAGGDVYARYIGGES